MRWRIPLVVLAVPILAFLAYACTDSTTLVEPDEIGGAISLTIIAGQDQAALPGEELADPLVVQATEMGQDGKEEPVPGVVVNFVVTQGGGSVYAGAAATDKNGFAADYLTVGPEYGTNRVEVRSVDSNGQKQVWGTFTARAVEDAIPPDVSHFGVCRPDPEYYPDRLLPGECPAQFLPGDLYMISAFADDGFECGEDPCEIRGMWETIEGQTSPMFPWDGAYGRSPVQAFSYEAYVVPANHKGGSIPIVVTAEDASGNIGTRVGELIVAKK